MIAYCWRNGAIGFGRRLPPGALEILRADGRRRFRRIVSALARHAYDGVTLLVPGVPEATSDVAALDACHAFRDRILKSLSLSSPPRHPDMTALVLALVEWGCVAILCAALVLGLTADPTWFAAAAIAAALGLWARSLAASHQRHRLLTLWRTWR